jgi:dihydrofolate reductase
MNCHHAKRRVTFVHVSAKRAHEARGFRGPKGGSGLQARLRRRVSSTVQQNSTAPRADRCLSNVTINLSMSLDGFGASPNDEIDPLHDWLFSGEHPSRSGFGSMTEDSRAVLDAGIETLGAIVVGRNTFEVSGRWGGSPLFGAPTFVVTHEPPTENRSDFHLCHRRRRDRDRAGARGGRREGRRRDGRDRAPAGDPRLVDEFVIHLIPVLLGEGKRLFDHLAAGWTWSARRSSRRPRASPTCASA